MLNIEKIREEIRLSTTALLDSYQIEYDRTDFGYEAMCKRLFNVAGRLVRPKKRTVHISKELRGEIGEGVKPEEETGSMQGQPCEYNQAQPTRAGQCESTPAQCESTEAGKSTEAEALKSASPLSVRARRILTRFEHMFEKGEDVNRLVNIKLLNTNHYDQFCDCLGIKHLHMELSVDALQASDRNKAKARCGNFLRVLVTDDAVYLIDVARYFDE